MRFWRFEGKRNCRYLGADERLGLNPIYDWDNGKKITGYEMIEVVVSMLRLRMQAIISDSFNAGNLIRFRSSTSAAI